MSSRPSRPSAQRARESIRASSMSGSSSEGSVDSDSDMSVSSHGNKNSHCMSSFNPTSNDFAVVSSMDKYLDKSQDGLNVRRQTPWISTIRGPASRLESLKTVAPTSQRVSKLSKKRVDYSESGSRDSSSDGSEEDSFSDESSSEDDRDRRSVRASSRLKEAGATSRRKYRDDVSSDYDSSAGSSPPRKWQPPKKRGGFTTSASLKKPPQKQDSESSENESYSSGYSSGPAEEETDVEEVEEMIVDKILAKRRQADDGWEYLVKWKSRSYMHATWLSQRELSTDTESDKRSTKLKNFNTKHHNGPTVAAFERGYYYNPVFESVERIIAVRSGNQYLVKWCGLPYGESTWELESSLPQNQFEAAWADFNLLNDYERCRSRFTTNSRESAGRVVAGNRKLVDPTAEFPRFLKAVPSRVTQTSGAALLPVEYEYVPQGKLLVADGEPPFRIFDFQKEGISWLLFNWHHSRGCILADEMGLGKTVQTSVTLAQMTAFSKNHGGGELTHLIIAPLSTIEQWRREIIKWTDLQPIVYHGNRLDRNVIRKYEWQGRIDVEESAKSEYPVFQNRKSFSLMPKFDVLVTTFETISMEPEVFNAPDFVWSSIVIDEAHKLKSAEGKARNSVLAIPCRHRILLTGTPIQNNVAELWNLLHLCAPSIWDDQEDFLAEFGNLKSAELTQKLQEKIQPFLLQRRKADVLAHLMPAKEETIVSVELTRLQKETYRAVYEKNIALLAGTGAQKKSVPALTNVHMELRKCCNHPFLVSGVEERVTSEYRNDYGKIMEYLINSSGKMVFLDKLLEKLRREKSKILIFSQFTMMLDLIEDYLRWRGYLFERLDGAVKGQQRQEAVDRFNRTPSPEEDEENRSFVFLLSTKAGGVGLNLTAANYVLLFDHDWNPQNDLQAQARCHRIGQTREVQIFRLVTRGTYEEKMFQVASQKLGLEQAVMSGGGSEAKSKLSKEEMDRLLKEGAYAMLRDDDEDEQKFCAENVDEILKNRSKTVSTFVAGDASGGFSKARFQVNEEAEDVDINDPNFWAKMASLGSLSITKPDNADQTEYLDYSQRKGRAQFGNKPPASSAASMDEESLADDSEYETKTVSAAKKDKAVEVRLKRMKLLVKYVLNYGLTENKDLFDARFGPSSDDVGEIPVSAYEDHLLLIVSLYVMAKTSVQSSSKFDEVHFCPSVRAAVGLLAQYRSLKESPTASTEPLLLDSMLPDLLNTVDRLDLTIPNSIVPHPIPKFVSEAIPKNRNSKKLILEIDFFNEIRFHVKSRGVLLRSADDSSRERDVELLRLVMEQGKEAGGDAVGRIEKILPKISLVRAFQLSIVFASFGYHPNLLDRALKATGYPWVRKFACGDSCLDMISGDDEVASLLTAVTEVPPATDFSDEAAFHRFILLQLPSDSPLSIFDVADYGKALLYRTISALGKKSDKHDLAVGSVSKPTKTNEYMFSHDCPVMALYPQRPITRLEAFKYMWRFQTLHFLRGPLTSDLFSQLPTDSATPTLVAIARGAGLDRWDFVTNMNRHIKPTNCMQTVMRFICKHMIESASSSQQLAAPVVVKRKSAAPVVSGEGPPSKTVKLTDFFGTGSAKKEDESGSATAKNEDGSTEAVRVIDISKEES